ncbi:hypothetical protein M8818_006737 [Zalaria obscura]|uniref:Uncharacterized protein n=1 Tax=Zalaria obscura TaxID=2024903 RepID=A0ACC3S7U5_9PEZI
MYEDIEWYESFEGEHVLELQSWYSREEKGVTIEEKRALDITYQGSYHHVCAECATDEQIETYWDLPSDNDGLPPELWCECDMLSHFVDRWLCLPCFLVEETEAYSRCHSRDRRTYIKDSNPAAEYPLRCKIVNEVGIILRTVRNALAYLS